MRGIEDARQAAQDVPDVPWSFAPMPTKSAEAPHIRRLSEPKYVKCTESGNYKAVVKALSRAVTSGMLPKGWVFVEGFPSLPLPGIFGPSLLHRDPFFPAPDAHKSQVRPFFPDPRIRKSRPSFRRQSTPKGSHNPQTNSCRGQKTALTAGPICDVPLRKHV